MPRILENVCHWQSPPGDVPSSMTAAMMPPAIARSRARSSFGHFLSTPETDLEEDDKDWGPLVLSAHQDAGAGHHSNGEEHMSHVHRGGHSNANAVDAGRHDVPHPHPIKVRVIRIQRVHPPPPPPVAPPDLQDTQGKDAQDSEQHVKPIVLMGGILAVFAHAYLWGNVFATLFKTQRPGPGPSASTSSLLPESTSPGEPASVRE
mmetsp:Transcript_47635/g.106922  ORF Transcript_47635/g.106922 Transcript_47635/m.106922 type:complete len:205 (-) Transcript_47635:15-629(-)